MEGKSEEEVRKTVEEKIHDVGLKGHEMHHPKELSGGMKQRVGIARALAVNPDFLVMDEPFSSVDYFTAKKLKDDLLVLFSKYDLSVLFVTHLIAEAIELSDRIIVMSKRPGRVIADIPVDLPRPRDPRSPEFFKLLDKITALIEQ
jgi:NitT/TauT family transport system ATP-binding protein